MAKSRERPLIFWIFLAFGLIALVFGVTSYISLKSLGSGLQLGALGGEDRFFERRGEIALLKIEGVIFEADKVLRKIEVLERDESVKGVVVRINSPGGAVGPSQEIFSAVLRLREKKPVVCSLGDIAASGGYYIAAACQKIFTNPGTLTGSIGVIMQFMNLEDLYEWAKMEPTILKAGKFKDLGSDARQMNPEERRLLQDMLDDVHRQFKQDIFAGRHFGDTKSESEAEESDATQEDQAPAEAPELDMEVIEKYADGRVFTGQQAVELGFADAVGGLHEATHEAANLAQVDVENYRIRREIRETPPFPGIFDFIEDPGGSFWEGLVSAVISRVTGASVESQKLRPGVPYYLPSHMFSTQGRR